MLPAEFFRVELSSGKVGPLEAVASLILSIDQRTAFNPNGAIMKWNRWKRSAQRRSSSQQMVSVKGLEDQSINGYSIAPRASQFPATLEAPTDYKVAKMAPLPDVSQVFFAPLEGSDLVAAFFVGIALMLGPDFLLAPAGLVSDDGIRPGYSLEPVIGELVTPDDQWLKDRKENLAAEAPLKVRLLVVLPFLFAGLLVERLLVLAVEDQFFVTSVGFIGVFGGLFLDYLRPKLLTRAEQERVEEFVVFSNERLQLGGLSPEEDIIKAFREFYPRYRFPDMSSTIDGVSVSDAEIVDVIKQWNKQNGSPCKRVQSSYAGGRRTAGATKAKGSWKGISLVPMNEQAPAAGQ